MLGKRLMSLIVALCFFSSWSSIANGEEMTPVMLPLPRLPEINVQDMGAVGNGLSDDTDAIQKALDEVAVSGGVVYFPKGRYLVKSVEVQGNNVTLRGDDATLVSNHPMYPAKYDAGTVRERSILRTDLKKQTVMSQVQYESDIKQGQNTLKFPSSVDMSVLRPYDLVMVTTTKGDPWAPSYRYGSLRYITSIDQKKHTVTLDNGVETTLKARQGNHAHDDSKLFVYRPMQNFRMEGLSFELKENGRQNGVFLDFVMNAKIKDVRFLGRGQNLTGISISGFYIDIADVFAEGFLSKELEIGYAVNVSGNHISVHDSTFIHAKHAISGADRRYKNNHIAYYNNTVIDPQSAALDVHGTGEYIRIHDNRILDVGKSFVGCGIWARGRHYEIYNNTITGANNTVPGSTCGIKLIESAIEDLRISNNLVSKVSYGLMTDLWVGAERDIHLEHNSFVDVDTGILMINLHGAKIEDNNIHAKHNGIILMGGNQVSIQDNQIRYEKAFGILLQANSKGTHPTEGIQLRNNTFTPGMAANNMVRIQQNYNRITITGNTVNTFFRNPPFKIINTSEARDLSHAIIENNRQVSIDPGT